MGDLIKFRRGTAAEWAKADPVLAAGEPGWETDTRKQKVGDGNSRWLSLPYFIPEPNLTAAFSRRDLTFNVKAYGAHGDGVQNDAPSVTSAIEAAKVKGGTVFFPPGTYLIASTLEIPERVHFKGAGVGATTLRVMASTNLDLFVSTGFDNLTGTASTKGSFQWSISDMTLDGNCTTNAVGGTAVKAYGYDFTLARLRITSFRRNGVYAEWHMNATPDTGASMEANLIDVNITHCGDEGIVWSGPHDSHWRSVVVWNCNQNGKAGAGVRVTPNGNSLNAAHCHVWGGFHKVAWYLEAPVSLTDCQGEGASAAQVVLAWPDSRIIGGHYFAAGAASTKGIQIGDSTHTGITGTFIDTKISNCTAGAVDFTHSSGTEIVRALVYQRQGSAYLGSPSFLGSHVELHVVGGATGALNITSGPVSLRNGGNASLTVTDGTTAKFNFDSKNREFQTINGSSITTYSGNYAGQTFRLDGATGTMTLGTALTVRAGTGTPEGAVSAVPGSLYLRTDGGPGTSLYVKESGAGSTGWVAK